MSVNKEMCVVLSCEILCLFKRAEALSAGASGL